MIRYKTLKLTHAKSKRLDAVKPLKNIQNAKLGPPGGPRITGVTTPPLENPPGGTGWLQLTQIHLMTLIGGHMCHFVCQMQKEAFPDQFPLPLHQLPNLFAEDSLPHLIPAHLSDRTKCCFPLYSSQGRCHLYHTQTLTTQWLLKYQLLAAFLCMFEKGDVEHRSPLAPSQDSPALPLPAPVHSGAKQGYKSGRLLTGVQFLQPCPDLICNPICY